MLGALKFICNSYLMVLIATSPFPSICKEVMLMSFFIDRPPGPDYWAQFHSFLGQQLQMPIAALPPEVPSPPPPPPPVKPIVQQPQPNPDMQAVFAWMKQMSEHMTSAPTPAAVTSPVTVVAQQTPPTFMTAAPAPLIETEPPKKKGKKVQAKKKDADEDIVPEDLSVESTHSTR